LEPFLKSQRVGSIEKLFVTHADSDHTNGLSYLKTDAGIVIRDLYLPACAQGDENYDSLISSLCGGTGGVTGGTSQDFPMNLLMDLSGTTGSGSRTASASPRIHYIKAGDVIPLKHGTITCMSPEDNEHPSEMNDQSLILYYRESSFSALFTGDAGKDCELKMLDAIENGSLPDIKGLTLLKVGHHGSNGSTSEELLCKAAPLLSVLSYGQGNRYGHPHKETLDLLDEYHVLTLGTADDGAITLTTDGLDSIHITQFCDSN